MRFAQLCPNNVFQWQTGNDKCIQNQNFFYRLDKSQHFTDLMCRRSASFLEKLFLHPGPGHLKFLVPVWILMCRVRSMTLKLVNYLEIA